jgi:hypothetical protein
MSGEGGGEVREDYGDINKAQQYEDWRQEERQGEARALGKLREGKKVGTIKAEQYRSWPVLTEPRVVAAGKGVRSGGRS